VWEVISTYKSVQKSMKRLKTYYPQLDELKVRAALSYYECYPEEIEKKIAENETWTPGTLKAHYPFTPATEK